MIIVVVLLLMSSEWFVHGKGIIHCVLLMFIVSAAVVDGTNKEKVVDDSSKTHQSYTHVILNVRCISNG